MTYILVRKDVSTFIPDPRAQSLLAAFLKGLYDPVYVEKCETEYHFLTVKGELREMALASIDMLELSAEAPEWIQETDILAEGGQDNFVISTRRKRIFAIQQEILTEKVHRSESALETITEEMRAVRATASKLEADLEYVVLEHANPDNAWSEEQSRIDAGFRMGIASLVLWFFSFVVICVQQRKLQRLEANQIQVQQEQAKKKHKHHHPKGALVEDSA